MTVQEIILSYFPHTPTDGQRQACAELVRFLFDNDPDSTFLLRGYAGTGKTSLVSALIKAAPLLKIKTLLMAPTGRAAKVLSGYSHKKAYTIHKKIYSSMVDSTGTVRSVRTKNNHSYTLFIVDEASMISAVPDETSYLSRHSLLDDLLDYVHDGNHCRLLLIGDAAQLPPVGSSDSPALSPSFLTAHAGLTIHTAELTEVVRQERQSGILHNATSLRHILSTLSPSDTFPEHLFQLEGFGDVVRLPGAELEETLNTEYSNGSLEDVVFICRSNKRANLFNQAIRNRILFREDEVGTGDYLMVVKNNYYWLDQETDMGFIANGDIVEVLSARNYQELYGFHFVDVSLRFVDYAEMQPVECKLLLETLHSESPSLTRDESRQLFQEVLADYADIPTMPERLNEVRNNPYYNALQVKFAYALTCHKTQGGQWPVAFIDQGFLTDDMKNVEYLRWLYTALTRATRKVYLLNFGDEFF